MNQQLWQEHGSAVAMANREYGYTAKLIVSIDAERKALQDIIDKRRSELDFSSFPKCLRSQAI